MKLSAGKIFLDALQSYAPPQLIDSNIVLKKDSLYIGDKQWQLSEYKGVYIIAAGKASRPMALALKERLPIPASHICCITPETDREEVFCISSSHPVPDIKSEAAGRELIAFVEGIPAGSLILFALSGGASSLVCVPADMLTIDDIQTVNSLLIDSGATIKKINSVRKHLSLVKGGQLLRHFPGQSTLVDLVISDVPDDDLETIGSGLTIPDSSTFQDAFDILSQYELWEKVPERIRSHIEKGVRGEAPETIKPGEDPIRHHDSFVIGSAKQFAAEVAEKNRAEGYKPWIADEPFNQPGEIVANRITQKLTEERKQLQGSAAFIFYGESTVNVTGKGKGGRNQELALRGALKIAGMEGITWLSAGTDGIDGPTDAAGAVVNGKTIEEAEKRGLSPEKFLKNNDSYHFHEQMKTLLKTGPTGNNIMDMVIVLVESN